MGHGARKCAPRALQRACKARRLRGRGLAAGGCCGRLPLRAAGRAASLRRHRAGFWPVACAAAGCLRSRAFTDSIQNAALAEGAARPSLCMCRVSCRRLVCWRTGLPNASVTSAALAGSGAGPAMALPGFHPGLTTLHGSELGGQALAQQRARLRQVLRRQRHAAVLACGSGQSACKGFGVYGIRVLGYGVRVRRLCACKTATHSTPLAAHPRRGATRKRPRAAGRRAPPSALRARRTRACPPRGTRLRGTHTSPGSGDGTDARQSAQPGPRQPNVTDYKSLLDTTHRWLLGQDCIIEIARR